MTEKKVLTEEELEDAAGGKTTVMDVVGLIAYVYSKALKVCKAKPGFEDLDKYVKIEVVVAEIINQCSSLLSFESMVSDYVQSNIDKE